MKKILLSTIAMLGFAGMAFAGTGTQSDPYTVSDIQSGNPTDQAVWVKGYIVGSVDGKALESGANFSTENASYTNILLADTSSEEEVAYCIPVGLKNDNALRGGLSLQGNPNNLGHEVIVQGTYTTYFNVKGIKDVDAYEWVGEVPAEPERPTFPNEVMTVSQVLSLMAQGATGQGSVKGYVSKIDEIDTGQYGNATYYLVDDLSDTSKQLEVFRGYYLDGAKFTSKDQLQKGAFVTVEGELINYSGTYEFTTGSKIVNYTAPEGGNVPDDEPTPGTPEGKTVTFDFTVPSSLGAGYSDEGVAEQEVILTGTTIKSGVVSMSFAANDGASTQPRLYYGSGNSAGWTFRFYNNTSFTVSVDEGYTLGGITFDGKNLGTDWTFSNGSFADPNWIPSGVVSEVTVAKIANGNNPTIKSMTVYYSEDAGVADIIAADDSEAVYYNLQGQKVVNPDKGIFIKVVGNKAAKVLRK